MPVTDSATLTDGSTAQELREVVEAAMERYHVPGVAVGITFRGEDLTLGFGVTSVENPLPVTEHTLFQIGSITKLTPDGGRIRVMLTPKGGFPLPESPPEPAPPPFHLLLTEGEGLIGTGEEVKGPVGEFIRAPDGAITWVRFGGRLHVRL